MYTKSQKQEHEHTAGNAIRVIAGLLVVSALVLSACGGATDKTVLSAAYAQTTTCTLPTGCILRESGSNAQWWADSWEKGTCRGHTEQDWIVTYKVNNDEWRNADQSKVRFYAADWSTAQWWKWAGELQVENNSLSSGGGITVCLSGVLSSDDVKGTYLWR